MAKARDRIRMTTEEVDEFLHGRHSMAVATIGADGRPHVVAMWYGFVDGALAFETYGKSQKIVNLRRDPRLTCLVEEGDAYMELRGVELIGTGTIVEGQDALVTLAKSLFERYDTGFPPDQFDSFVAPFIAKRVVVRIDVERVVSWDHSKLAG